MEHTIEIRVRYQETDGQGRVHHANYLTYFEQGRVELMRSLGMDYRRVEEEGFMLVVTKFTCAYHRPATFDQLLRLFTRVTHVGKARIEHAYTLHHEDLLLVEGESTVACVDHTGKVRRLPDWLRQGSI